MLLPFCGMSGALPAERLLAGLVIRNLVVAQTYFEQMDPGELYRGHPLPAHLVDRVKAANALRLRAEAGARQAILALQAVRCPRPIVIAKVDIHNGAAS